MLWEMMEDRKGLVLNMLKTWLDEERLRIRKRATAKTKTKTDYDDDDDDDDDDDGNKDDDEGDNDGALRQLFVCVCSFTVFLC